MQKFLVVYLAPAAGLEDWMKKPASERKEAEEKMQGEWRAWAQAHKGALLETAGAGKTKLVTPKGVSDIRNDIMMYSMMEAESPEAAAKLFVGHPHLGIPDSSIQIMPANVLPGM